MLKMEFEFKNYIQNIPGFHTHRKIIVIESDDWGSNRMPSKEVFETLKAKGLTHDGSRYDKYDTLANENDLLALFDVLHSVRDKYGNPAKITPISVVANPDFKKIEESGFKEYHYELFTETLRRRGETRVTDLWKQGINKGYFVPEFHGREHLNIARWMKALQEGHEPTCTAFKYGVYGITLKTQQNNTDSYLAAYDFYEPFEIDQLKEITVDGLDKFEKIFGFRSSYFVPPNGPLSSHLYETLANSGIKAIQAARYIYPEPVGFGKSHRRIRFFGMKNKYGQIFTLRNVFFEPNDNPQLDWVSKCLREIGTSFNHHKPAIVSSHRVNYIGAFHPENRERSLNLLKQLLLQIIKRWPDAEFLTSSELSDLIFKGINK
jgi:hypothetical protein